MPSQIFESVGMKKPRYSAFDLSHEKKLSGTLGNLIPILLQEVLPGDFFRVKSEIMLRFAPMIAPVMHRHNIYVHYFFVPNRIIWDEWEDFITGGVDGTSAPTFPQITLASTSHGEGTLGDYLGLPTGAGSGYRPPVSALPFRAYQQIYNDYYRDETLSPEINIYGTASTISQMRERSYEKDYFTSALNSTQRGPQVTIAGDIVYKSITDVSPSTGTPLTGAENVEYVDSGTLPGLTRTVTSLDSLVYENIDSLGITIEELRQSTALQTYLENNMRGGYRYIEQLLHRFGVKSSDGRLQRAEYLGGGRQPVVISEVLNTSATATQEQGTMAGHGISVGSQMATKKRFEEHGYLLGIMSVIPRTSYQQGIPKHWLRSDKLDFYSPEFANLGEQEVQLRELYYDSADTAEDQEGAFGYQQRYAEYKYGVSTVHGDFKTTLDYWHNGRIFGSTPALNDTFIRVTGGDHNRIFAVTTGDHMFCQIYNEVKARRPMPYHARPTIR